jgi:hypothetical protein
VCTVHQCHFNVWQPSSAAAEAPCRPKLLRRPCCRCRRALPAAVGLGHSKPKSCRPPTPHSWLPKPWAEPSGGGAALVRAAGFAAAARGGGGSFGGGSDSLFCTNVSGLKGNSPILIGLMEYFSVRPAGVVGCQRTGDTPIYQRRTEQAPPFPSLHSVTPSASPHAAPPAPCGFLPAHRRRPPAALCQVRQAAQAHSHVRPSPRLGTR